MVLPPLAGPLYSATILRDSMAVIRGASLGGPQSASVVSRRSGTVVPDRIELVPEHARVVEALGGQCGIWGALFIAVACLMAVPGDEPWNLIEWVITGSSAVLGLCLTGYEVWRRRNRTVLVRDGEHIAVFRKGSLDLILTPGEFTLAKPELALILKIAICLGTAAALFTAIGIVGLVRDHGGAFDDVIILLLGLTSGFSLAAAARTCFFFSDVRTPIKNNRWLAEETVLIPSRRLKELFP
jgi:hypothetical protein